MLIAKLQQFGDSVLKSPKSNPKGEHMTQLPAVSLAAVPGRRMAILEVAKEVEKRGFPGIYGPSLSDNLALCFKRFVRQLSRTVL